MCIICLKRKGQTFEPELVTRMIDMGNRDGCGLMWVEGERTAKGKIKNNTGRVKKIQTMATGSEFAKIYAAHMNTNIGIHVRNATLGEENEENCHPVTVLSKDLGHKIDLEMMHNGTIKDVQVDKKFSDSYNFGTKFLRGYLAKDYTRLYEPEFQYMLCAMLGPNKLLFLDSFEHFLVINRDMWSVHHPSGCLVSTSSEIKVFASSYTYGPATNTDTSSKTILTESTDEGDGPPIAWKHREGHFVLDSDGRSHFAPKKAVSDVKDDDTTVENEADGTDNGISLNLDKVAIQEWVEKIKDYDEASIEAFVIENPLDALHVITYLSHTPTTDLYVDEEFTTTGLMIAHQPTQATKMLNLILTRRRADVEIGIVP